MPGQIAPPGKSLAAGRAMKGFRWRIAGPRRAVGGLRTVVTRRIRTLDHGEGVRMLLRVTHVRGVHLREGRMRGIGEDGVITGVGAFRFHRCGRVGLGGNELLLKLRLRSNDGGGRTLSVQDGGDVHARPERWEGGLQRSGRMIELRQQSRQGGVEHGDSKGRTRRQTEPARQTETRIDAEDNKAGG